MEPSGAPWRVLETTDSEQARETDRPRNVPRVAIGAAVVAVLAAAAIILVLARSSTDIAIDGAGVLDAGTAEPVGVTGPGAAVPTRRPSPSPLLVVEVAGAVARPGVYRLTAGSRVGDAIAAAGGFGAAVDARLADRQLNLAALVRDGDKIRVPARGESPGPAGAAGSASEPSQGPGSGPVDLNHATAEQLDGLPGVGPATAAKIIAAREKQPFASLDDLGSRKVVGAATLEKIRPLATVTP